LFITITEAAGRTLQLFFIPKFQAYDSKNMAGFRHKIESPSPHLQKNDYKPLKIKNNENSNS
jgi:hypothetical protein